ncbi:hypothetical protein RGU12_18550 [Fredinandcohnia sp. QZ13]|uniref:hypothetical protein n=1 Tax=Fredinandcohnia sp. QZ13 TaxID=3073144 RepID=UPI002852F476|nr:hypothetical protein [Fredinandcohnia sp. QZ13]MDR4889496.1 hypothetical protein [Fredinandcohnia sp. QZ13]
MSRKIIFLFILLTFLIGCTANSKTASELFSTLDQNLSQKDLALLNSLESHVQKFIQLNEELDMLLDEMKKEDGLEAAIETMQIANEEAMYIYNLIELDDQPTNENLHELRSHVQASIEQYMEAMNMQLEGISTGNPKKTDEAYEEMKIINEELDKLYRSMKG